VRIRNIDVCPHSSVTRIAILSRDKSVSPRRKENTKAQLVSRDAGNVGILYIFSHLRRSRPWNVSRCRAASRGESRFNQETRGYGASRSSAQVHTCQHNENVRSVTKRETRAHIIRPRSFSVKTLTATTEERRFTIRAIHRERIVCLLADNSISSHEIGIYEIINR